MDVVWFADMPEPEPIDCSQAIPGQQIAWERIVAEEPEVEYVLNELRGIQSKRKRWGSFPKMRLAKLVGWHARNPKLRSPEAYRMVMGRMWDLLL